MQSQKKNAHPENKSSYFLARRFGARPQTPNAPGVLKARPAFWSSAMHTQNLSPLISPLFILELGYAHPENSEPYFTGVAF